MKPPTFRISIVKKPVGIGCGARCSFLACGAGNAVACMAGAGQAQRANGDDAMNCNMSRTMTYDFIRVPNR
jgi:hypothetical protein